MKMKPSIKMKPMMIGLDPAYANIFETEAKKIALPTSSFIRMILIQWLADTGKLDNMGHIGTQVSIETPDGEATKQKPEEYKL